jgi:hypothetical protein
MGAPISLPKERCETCRYYRLSPEEYGADGMGICCAHPPQPIKFDDEGIGEVTWQWPAVLVEDWCGEYRAKE